MYSPVDSSPTGNADEKFMRGWAWKPRLYESGALARRSVGIHASCHSRCDRKRTSPVRPTRSRTRWTCSGSTNGVTTGRTHTFSSFAPAMLSRSMWAHSGRSTSITPHL